MCLLVIKNLEKKRGGEPTVCDLAFGEMVPYTPFLWRRKILLVELAAILGCPGTAANTYANISFEYMENGNTGICEG
jgi:hypothetical protein